MANARLGTHKVKTRAEVARTTAKMYRQKGTGNARHGSRKAPIFVGGGVAHGPSPRSYEKKMPRQMRRAALRSALTVKAQEGKIVVVDNVTMSAPKTKEMAQTMKRLVGSGTSLLVLPDRNENVERSVRNLTDVKALNALYLNIRDLLGHDKVVFDAKSIEVLVSFLSPDADLADMWAEGLESAEGEE
jgi:large subunit ribosomal protein L4